MLGVTDYLTFVVTIIVFLAIPGPGNLALVTSTSKGGIQGGLAATFGVILGDQVLMWLAVAGALVGSMFALRDFVQPAVTAPEALESDSAASTQPEVQDSVPAPTVTTYAEDSTTRAEEVADDTPPAPRGPRKPSIPALRVPLMERTSVPTPSLAPANAVCAQLSSVRHVRALNDDEAQLWLTHCGSAP